MTSNDVVTIMVKRFNQLLTEIQILNDKIDKLEQKISKLNEKGRY